jgi:beta-phosphoglucomutase-like phosphatase (HAD superfamily)
MPAMAHAGSQTPVFVGPTTAWNSRLGKSARRWEKVGVKSALLFDLDGTLVDSDAGHLRAFQRVFAPYGIRLGKEEYDARILGADNAAIARAFLPDLTPAEQAATLEAKEASYRDNLGAIEPIAGVGALLDYAEANDLGCAVVTNAPRANVDKALDALGLGARLPVRVVSGDVERAKPDPMPYLTALQRLGADAACSLAFEDSLSGLSAARGAGLAVVGLTTNLDAATLVGAGAELAVADFTDPRLIALIERRRSSPAEGA